MEDRRAQAIYDSASRIWRSHEPTRNAMFSAWRLYSNQPLMGLSPRLYKQRAPTATGERLSFNVVKSVTDSYVALLTKDEPKITFQTAGADYGLQRKADRLETFVDGIYYDADFYETASLVALDSALFGLGIVKIFADEDEDDDPHIRIERVFPWELICDAEEATWGKPPTVYQIRYVDRLALMEEYPEQASEILSKAPKAASFDSSMSPTNEDDTLSDLVIVIEAWHVARKGQEGRHCITTGDVLLVDEEYSRKCFPFEILYRLKPTIGIWGSSLAEELKPIQREMNVLLDKIRRSHHLLAAGHWLVENSSQINTNTMNNQIGSIVRYRGIPPQFLAVQAVAPDVYAHLDRLYSRAYEIIGISPLAAQSQIPANLQGSGKALLVYADVQSQRFQPSYREYQHWFRRIARQVITVAREISDAHPSFEVRAAGRSTMSVVRWADASLRDAEFTLKMAPTNKFADDPAGVLKQIQEFANSGMMNPQDAARLLSEHPDFEAWAAQINAPYDLVMSLVERMIDQGEYVGPEPFMPLNPPDGNGAIKWVQFAYLKAKLDGVPEERLDLLRRWLTEAHDMASPPPSPPANENGAPPPPGQAAPPPPPGPPGPPPPMAA
jgi:hypothetical protein